MKKRKDSLLQRMMAVLLSMVLVVGMISNALPAYVFAQENTNLEESVNENMGQEPGGDEVQYVTAFWDLPEDVKTQTVSLGTDLEELMLPDSLEAVVIGRETGGGTEQEPAEGTEQDSSEETEQGSSEETEQNPAEETEQDPMEGTEQDPTEETEQEPAEGTEQESAEETEQEPAEGTETDPSKDRTDELPVDADIETKEESASSENLPIIQESYSVAAEEYYAEHVITVEMLQKDKALSESQEETVAIEGVIWKSEPEYDGNQAGIYVFTAVLPEGYVVSEGISVPQITVTVTDEETNGEQAMSTKVGGWHFTEDDIFPKGELIYDGEVYSLVLAGGDREVQIPFEDIIELLPDSVMAELTCPKAETETDSTAAEADSATTDSTGESAKTQEKILPITGWECAEYVQDEEGYLPYRGEFVFRAQMGADEEGRMYEMAEETEPVNVRLVFDAPMMMASVTAVPGTITSNQEWGTQTLAAGTYIINPGVTVTVSGKLTIDGNVTIKGGGTLRWTSAGGNAMEVQEGAQVELENVTLDGNKISFSRSALLFRGNVTLKNGTVIENFKSTGGSGSSAGYKGVIAVYQNGVLNIYDGVTIRKNECGSGIIALYQEDDGNPNKKPSSAIVNMYGGTIKGNTVKTLISDMGVIWNWCGNLNISGGTVIAEGGEYAVHTQGNYSVYNAKTVISGGTFTGVKNGAICAGKDSTNNSEITITGGVFSGKTAATVNYGTIEIRGGTYNGTQYALSSNGAGSLEVYGGEFTGGTKAYSGSITTQTNKVKVGNTKETAANWDKTTSLNTYKYVAIGEIATRVYNITYNKNGGTIADESNYTSYTYGKGLTLPTPARTGYTFGGWYTTSDFTGSAVTSISGTDTGEKNYYAKWTPISYNITYELNGGNAQGNPASYTIESNTITLHNPTKEGHTFTGWSGTNLTGSNNTSVIITQGSTGNRSYIANWVSETYGVTLYTNGGSGGTNLTSYAYGTGAQLPVNWTKKGYTFGGWYTTSNFTGSAVTSISGTDTGEKSYYAKWTDNIAPVIGTLEYSYQPKNLWQMLIGKESLVITVPVTEEGSGATEIIYGITPAQGTTQVKKAAIEGGQARITISADFKGTVAITCTDTAGNKSAGVTVGAGLNATGIIIEDNAPQIAFQADNKNVSAEVYDSVPVIEVTVTDDKDNAVSAGLASVTYQVGNSEVIAVQQGFNASLITESSFVIPADKITRGQTVITVTAVDNAGNQNTVNQLISVHEHSYGTEWKYDAESHWHECACKDKSELTSHNFGGWVTDKEATESEEGQKHRTCQTCKYEENAVIPALGKIDKDVQTDGKAPATQISTSTEELADMLLTDGEKKEMENGKDIKIILDVKDAGNSVSVEDKKLVEETLKGFMANSYTMGQYLDISLYKMIGDSRTDITETEKKIRIVIDVPHSLKNVDSKRTRTFAIIRTHDGSAEILTDLDNNEDTITMETDRFSTYAIVYKDTPKGGNNGSSSDSDENSGGGSSGSIADANNNDSNSNSNTTNNNSSNVDAQKDDEPKTGDATNIELYATLSMIAGLAYLLLYFADRKRGMTEETKKELVFRLVGWAKRGGKTRKLAALITIFILLVYYHSIGKKTYMEWKEIYGE